MYTYDCVCVYCIVMYVCVFWYYEYNMLSVYDTEETGKKWVSYGNVLRVCLLISVFVVICMVLLHKLWKQMSCGTTEMISTCLHQHAVSIKRPPPRQKTVGRKLSFVCEVCVSKRAVTEDAPQTRTLFDRREWLSTLPPSLLIKILSVLTRSKYLTRMTANCLCRGVKSVKRPKHTQKRVVLLTYVFFFFLHMFLEIIVTKFAVHFPYIFDAGVDSLLGWSTFRTGF